MRTGVRAAIASVAALAVLGPIGWFWYDSLVPGTYDMAAMGYADFGGGPPVSHAHQGGLSVADLREMCTAAGLEVVTATGAYSFLVPPAWLLGKLERGESKSDVGRNESGLFGLFGLLAKLERRLLRRVSLPFGLSAVVIARKPR